MYLYSDMAYNPFYIVVTLCRRLDVFAAKKEHAHRIRSTQASAHDVVEWSMGGSKVEVVFVLVLLLILLKNNI